MKYFFAVWCACFLCFELLQVGWLATTVWSIWFHAAFALIQTFGVLFHLRMAKQY